MAEAANVHSKPAVGRLKTAAEFIDNHKYWCSLAAVFFRPDMLAALYRIARHSFSHLIYRLAGTVFDHYGRGVFRSFYPFLFAVYAVHTHGNSLIYT